MTFSDFKAHSEPLFKKLKILKVKDNIFLQNCLFVHDFYHCNLPKSFNKIFTKIEHTHNNVTRNAKAGMIQIPSYNSVTYGLNSIYKHCIDSWNYIANEFKDIKDDDNVPIDLHKISRSKLKLLVTEYLMKTYLE